MARTAEFSINSLSMTAELKKVDRKKIPGNHGLPLFMVTFVRPTAKLT